jgi:hypothetical protein
VISRRERRVLRRMENTIRGSDAGLSGRFAVFTRLAADEGMPRAEQLARRVVVLSLATLMLLIGGTTITPGVLALFTSPVCAGSAARPAARQGPASVSTLHGPAPVLQRCR